MPSTFLGLETGARALAASQLALDVTGQNTANVGTPGYSRQSVTLEPTAPYGGPGFNTRIVGQLGTGVTVSSIDRIRDQYLDTRVQGATSDQRAANALSSALSRVETAFGEPSATGVGAQITALFGAFADLSANPESGAVRATVLNKAQAVVTAFHSVGGELANITPDLQARITADIGQANDLAGRIAALNKEIGAAVAHGDHPNDLLDNRTALVGQLSGLVNIQVIDTRNPDTNQPTGKIQINVGGFTAVQDDTSTPLPAASTSANGALGLQTADGQTIPLQGGEVFGLLKATTLISGYQSDLDTLAANLISATNAQHSAGYGLDGATGRNFFTGNSATGIGVDPAISGNLDAIAAATAPVPPATAAPGNGDNARALAALSSQPVIGLFSLDQYYNSKVAGIGADSQRFQANAGNQSKVVAQLTSQQSSVSGVNLDEELTKMLQYQRTYQAAARIINVQDDLLNRIINGLGVGAPGA